MSNPRDADRLEQMQRRLDQVEDEIEAARRDAEDASPKPPKESFKQKGTIQPDKVDDAIVPPG